MNAPAPTRKQQILQSLAVMLEESPGARITTAGLARQVGVSEAALYRHFPSKAKMYEGLIEFIEDTVFSRITVILADTASTEDRCHQMLFLLLTFAEKNPGITRILTGDPLAGESDRLRQRVSQFFERLEMQFRQIMREAQIREQESVTLDISVAANLMLNLIEGRLSQYVRSDFNKAPTLHLAEEWQAIAAAIFVQDSVLGRF